MSRSPESQAAADASRGPAEATSYDFVIVGAGTAGCLLANRLSRDPAVRVLLVEAGGPDNYHWIHVPVGYLYCIGNPRTDWCFSTEPDAGLNGRALRYPRGKVLGGCSSINGMIYMRGQARDYDGWAELTGDPAWRWDECLKAFRAHEDHHRVSTAPGGAGGAPAAAGKARTTRGAALRPDTAADDAHFRRLHGHGGEWRVERQRLRWDVLDAFALAAEQAGIPRVNDFNGGDNEGVAYFDVNQRAGWRWNTSKAFLRPVKGRKNLTVWTRTQARRLVLSAAVSTRCTGVELIRNGQALRVLARRGVVLCAGSIGSPQLLELSGIGDAQRLKAVGIEPGVHLPGVGENLQDHLQIRAVYKVSGTRTLNALSATLWGKAWIAGQYLLRRSGPMSMAPSQLGAFTRSDPQQRWANLQYHVQPLSLDAFGEPLHRFPAITASVCNLNPQSRGSVHVRSADHRDAPLIAPNYLATEADRRVAADSLRLTRRIMSMPALARHQPQEHRPGAQYTSDEDLARLAGDIATTIFHPVGTTRMGRDDDPMAVTTPRLQVRDGRGGVIAGLHVVDAGVMPTITSGNTNSPTLMIAERAAAWILDGSPATLPTDSVDN